MAITSQTPSAPDRLYKCALVPELRHKPWGETRYTSGTTPTNYTYTGQYSNMGDFGLMLYNARWYDPSIGRFAQPDALVPDPSKAQDWDRYSYTRNNPIRYTDPTGHLTQDQIMKMLHVETWKEALAMFEEDGKYEGQYGLLELLRQVEVGDTIYGVNGRPHSSDTEEIEVGKVVEIAGVIMIWGTDDKPVSLASFANHPAYGREQENGEKSVYGNHHYYEHIDFNVDNSDTVALDLLGAYGSLVGLGWMDETPKLVSLGNNVSRATSVYGVGNSLWGGDETDLPGAVISGGGMIAGPVGFLFSLVGVAKDAIYIGR